MARPRQDGMPAREVNRRKLTDLFVSSRKGQERPELIWDLKQPGLALSVRPTSKKAWKVIYRFHGRPRWLHLGDARAIGLADARRLAARVMLDVAEGKDPGAERRAERLTGTFAELASQYVELHAKKHNKSWRQAEAGPPSPPTALGKAEGQRHHPRRRARRDDPDRTRRLSPIRPL